MDSATGNSEPLLTSVQVADWLQVKESTVNQWAKVGKLPVVKVGILNRFRRSEIEAWLASNSRPAEVAGVTES